MISKIDKKAHFQIKSNCDANVFLFGIIYIIYICVCVNNIFTYYLYFHIFKMIYNIFHIKRIYEFNWMTIKVKVLEFNVHILT